MRNRRKRAFWGKKVGPSITTAFNRTQNSGKCWMRRAEWHGMDDMRESERVRRQSGYGEGPWLWLWR